MIVAYMVGEGFLVSIFQNVNNVSGGGGGGGGGYRIIARASA